MDTNLEAFKILGWKQEYLIGKVLFDNGIKTQREYFNWLKTNAGENLPQAVTNNVGNAIRDFEINFINPNNVPNIFKLK